MLVRGRMPAVDDMAEKLRGLFRIVDRRVRLIRIPGYSGGDDRSCQNGLTIGEAGQGHGVEGAKRVKGVTFVCRSFNRRIDETEIEEGIVPDQDGAFAATGLDRGPDWPKYVVECRFFRQRFAKGVIGVYPVKSEGLGIQIGSLEWLYMAADGLCRLQVALVIHPQYDSGDFQQCVGLGLESGRFNIDDHRQVATKALADHGVVRFVFHARQDTQCEAR